MNSRNLNVADKVVRILAALPLFLGLMAALAGTTAARAKPVALELVLAVDCSSSVSEEEFKLQMFGIAQAFRDPAVLAAIAAVGSGGIAVSLVQWAGARTHVQALDWAVLTGPGSSRAFADAIETLPRLFEGGATAIGDAMEFSAALIEANSIQGLRRVIDVSGDGIANQGQSPARIRAQISKLGITVNGLAIMNEEPKLARYFMAGVVGGPGGFMLTAADYEDFSTAILQKLIHEISGPPIAYHSTSREVTAARLRSEATSKAIARPQKTGLGGSKETDPDVRRSGLSHLHSKSAAQP